MNLKVTFKRRKPKGLYCSCSWSSWVIMQLYS